MRGEDFLVWLAIACVERISYHTDNSMRPFRCVLSLNEPSYTAQHTLSLHTTFSRTPFNTISPSPQLRSAILDGQEFVSLAVV